MKKNMVLILGLLLSLAGVVRANSTLMRQTMSADLGSLRHSNFSVWRISFAVAGGGPITGADFSIDQLYNWDARDNILYLHLLGRDELSAFSFDNDGIYTGIDDPSYGNYLARFGGLELDAYTDHDGPSTREKFTYTFSDEALSVLNSSVVDGICQFGLGLDTDCGFSSSQAFFESAANAETIPAPGAILLSGIGIGLVGWLRKRRTL